MSKNDGSEGRQPSRRRALQLIGGSTVGLIGLTGLSAAQESPTAGRNRKDGKSLDVPDGYENVRSFVVYEGSNLSWHLPEKRELSVQSHCPGNGGLHWGPGFTWQGVTFEFTVRDCPDTCEWEVSITALNQTYGLVTSDDCETEEHFSVGVYPLQFEGEIQREQVAFGSTVFVIVSADITITYYSPWNGWQQRNVSWELTGKA